MNAPTTIPPLHIVAEPSIELLASHIGRKLVSRPYDESRDVIDIAKLGVCYVDADLRKMDAAGLHIFTGASCDIVSWEKLQEVVFRNADQDHGMVLDFRDASEFPSGLGVAA